MADYNPNQFSPEVGELQRIARGESKKGGHITVPYLSDPPKPERPCPNGSALIIKGAWYPCDMMTGMHESCDTHDGWPHSNRMAEAIWQ